MKKFEAISLDYRLCQKEVEQFRAWLASKGELSERAYVLPFFRNRPQMATLFGMFNTRMVWPDQIAWEFDIYGDFACDPAIGQASKGAYCFVEFEDARSNSVFKQQGKKATREWGPRFDHGYSQIIDWVHKLDGRSVSVDLLTRFGCYEITYEAVLVVGRDQHLDPGEIQRLVWRSDNVAVNTRKISCLTFDQLLIQFEARLGALQAVEASLIRSQPGERFPKDEL